MRLSLMPLTRERADQLASGDLALLRWAPNAEEVAEVVRNVAHAHAVFYEKSGATAPWLGYLAWDGGGLAIGTCGFNGPCVGGAVEIAYFTFPAYEGRSA